MAFQKLVKSYINFAVIARDPNMSVSKISMGETKMLECHYKFGVYDEPIPKPEENTNIDIEQDSSVYF